MLAVGCQCGCGEGQVGSGLISARRGPTVGEPVDKPVLGPPNPPVGAQSSGRLADWRTEVGLGMVRRRLVGGRAPLWAV